ncbi:synaptogyrin [Ixodes scapularis]|uniref:Synaptogyrin n=1 Tax=Ixodes scapularis TaxID=6945 RepID=B7P7J0_IXOSC|nr:synaptogyrin [Ixodes scapularis]EEC02562.1 synaptogyrin, putative [Ixodes scapularis]|eukprot:XP_002399233.1 synaptogyrin, putative [Ixodes scapularis]
MNGGAYGAGKAGQAFDPIMFLIKPQVTLRILCWLFSVVVFGCISSGAWLDERCLYNSDSNACNFGVAIGVIAFLASCGFLAIEAMFENFSSIKIRKRAVIADMAFSGLWAFMWVVCFCYLCDAWRKSDMPSDGYGLNNIRAAIAFSFFSVFAWASCVFFAYHRYRQGADAPFMPSYEADPSGLGGATPFTGGYPGDMGDAYQEPPFSTKADPGMGVGAMGAGNFQAPAY